MKKLALFDVDNTLLAGYSGYYTSLRLIRLGVVRKRRLAQAVFFKLISPLYKVDARTIYTKMISDMAGWSLEQALTVGKRCFEEDLQPRIFTEALELIREHQAKGHPTYFITAGPYMTLKSMGDALNVCADYAPRPIIRDGVIVPEIQEPLAYLEGKLKVAELIVKREGVPLEDCYFYSDNIDDRILLESVGHARVVNPDRPLKKLAKQRGWPIMSFNQMLGGGQIR